MKNIIPKHVEDYWDRQPVKPEYTQSDIDEAVQLELRRARDLIAILVILVAGLLLIISFFLMTSHKTKINNKYGDNPRYIVINNDDGTIDTWKCEEI